MAAHASNIVLEQPFLPVLVVKMLNKGATKEQVALKMMT